jgi:erythromycin esterase-like protein
VSRADSYEHLFHDVGLAQFALLMNDSGVREVLRSSRLERAIGVIYRPHTERISHYFPARLAEQFDAVMHIDETHALQPLEQWARDELDLPDTYPSAL